MNTLINVVLNEYIKYYVLKKLYNFYTKKSWIIDELVKLLFFLKALYNIKKVFFIWRNFMTASILPSIFVPLVGLVFPAIAMASLFLYIEKDQIN